MHYQRRRNHGSPEYFVPKTIPERFWTRVEVSDGCWNWTGATAGGYGQFNTNRYDRVPAHRQSYEMHVGPVPAGLLVCHHCDNKICVRPDHLFVGTNSDNMQDMVRKGRHPKTLAFFRAKLNAAKVRAIRRSRAKTVHLARRYRVSPTTIYLIRIGKSWRHV